jgi:hypothetical protein
MTVKLPDDSFTRLTPPPPRTFISIGEAAAIAGVTGECIRIWAKQIDGLGHKRVGRWAIREKNLRFILDRGIERYRERYATAQARQARQQNQEDQENQSPRRS